MIVRVIARIRRLRCSPTHNAPGTAVAGAWGCDRVFKVITAFLGWQQTLPVSKNGSILGVGKWTTLVNQPIGL